MSIVTVQGNAGGTGTLTVTSPNTNSNYTVTLPTATTTLVGTDATQTLTNKTLTSPTLTSPTINGTPVMGASVITSGAAVSASGTSVAFTGIPSWVKRITVMVQGLSTSGTSLPIIQLGTGSTTYTASGYVGSTTDASTAVATVNHNTGITLQAAGAAATVTQGSVIISNLTGNVWASSGVIGRSNTTNTSMIGGTISLAAVLTAVRVTTVNGTDTFDAGTINILYE